MTEEDAVLEWLEQIVRLEVECPPVYKTYTFASIVLASVWSRESQ